MRATVFNYYSRTDMEHLGLIPARYSSTRFPGKLLQRLGTMSVLQHTYNRAATALGGHNVWVATDSPLIADHVKSFGGQVVETHEDVKSGTERCAHALEKLGIKPRGIINIQGDEPFISPDDIKALARTIEIPGIDIATLVRRFDQKLGFEALFSPDVAKVTIDANGDAMYFSRSIIPYVRDWPWQQWLTHATFHTHIGVYAFKYDALRGILTLPTTPAGEAESLEQLNWLENGMKIRTVLSHSPRTIGIDTPEDLREAQKYLETLSTPSSK